MNDVPLRDHITPHYVQLGLLKFRDVVKILQTKFYKRRKKGVNKLHMVFDTRL